MATMAVENIERDIKTIVSNMKKTRKVLPFQFEELERLLDRLFLVVKNRKVHIDSEETSIAECILGIKEALRCALNETDDIKKNTGRIEEELTHKIAKLESELECMKKEQERTKSELECIKKQKERTEEELTSLKSELVTGQIASCFEREIVKAVLDGVEETDQKVAIWQLEDRISNKKSRQLPPILETEEQRRQANDNWNKIDEKYSLRHDYYSSVPHLKTQRNLTAHPKMTIKDAMEFLKSKESSNIAEKDRKICIDMLEVLTKMGVPDITCK